MSLTNLFYTKFFLPLLDSKRYAGLDSALRNGKRAERESLDQNFKDQWAALTTILQHAYDTVPFYKRRFDENRIRVTEFHGPKDLAEIPVLTRQDIRENFDDLWSRKFDRTLLQEAATGGTTDSPVPILRSPDCVPRRTAVQTQFNRWAGLLPGDKVFWLWGAQSDFAADPSWRWRMYVRYFMRQQWAPTSLLNERILSDYAKKIDSFRPVGIMAYPTPLTAFCEYLLSTGYKGYRPKTAICTAEPLLGPQREIIESALGCKVFEHYGTRDFGLVAAECEEHDGLHVNPSAIFVETIPLDGASLTEGLHELVITDLLNPGFPLIRYKINDCVHPHSQVCACGRGFPLISHIEGRVNDNFVLPSGDIVPGVALTNRAIKTASGIKKMQVIQESLRSFTINYVPDTGFDGSSLENLRAKLVEFLGRDVKFEFHSVEEIPREKSGKTRLCISKVQPASLLTQAMK